MLLEPMSAFSSCRSLVSAALRFDAFVGGCTNCPNGDTREASAFALTCIVSSVFHFVHFRQTTTLQQLQSVFRQPRVEWCIGLRALLDTPNQFLTYVCPRLRGLLPLDENDDIIAFFGAER